MSGSSGRLDHQSWSQALGALEIRRSFTSIDQTPATRPTSPQLSVPSGRPYTSKYIYAQHFCLPRVLMTRSTAWNSSNAPLAPPGGVLPSKTLEGDILQLHRPSRAAIARLRQRRGGVHVPETVTGVVDSIEKQKQATIHGSLAMAPDRPAKGHRGTLF